MKNVFTSFPYRTVAQHTASAPLYIRFLSLFLFLIIGIGNTWGDNVTYSSITTSTSLTNGQITLSSSTFSMNTGYYGHGNSSGGSLTITANSGYTISGVVITFETEKTDRTGGGSSASVSSATHYSYSISSKTGTISLKDGGIAQQTVTFTSVNKCRITAMTVTYASSATPRTFESGQKIYFKDASGNISGMSSLWKISTGNVYAYFYDDAATPNNAWASSYGDLVSGSWNAANAIYEFTVPQLSSSDHTWTGVIFTRGTAATWGDGFWNQTSNQTPDVGQNLYIQNTSAAVGGKYNGSWGKYSPNPVVLGDFNDWDPDQGGLTDGRLIVDLEASTDYKFKVLVGETWWGLNDGSITNTTSSWYLFYSGQGNCTVTSGEAGEYCFHWNNSTHYLGVFYPQARLAKQKYIYFDARSESNWKESVFAARFYFKYYDSGTDQSNSWCAKANALEDWVYYTTVPNDDYVGQVQMNRYSAVDGTYWNTASIIHAHSRTSSKQNCMVAPSSGWDNITLTWGTYCPPISSSTLSDNSTSVISWTSGDGTSGNPYLVPADGTIKVSASATKAVNDDNMIINYDFKVGGSSAQSGTGSTFDKGSLTNNTTYTISLDTWNSYNSTSGTKNTSATALYYKALTTYSVTHTKTNVTTSDRSGAAAAAYYLPYSATFTASTGYNLPGTITVKFGSTTKASGTDYTWNSSTGVVSIPASKIDGDVTITVTGVAKTTTLTFDPNTANHGTSGDGGATATYASNTLTSITHTTPADGYALEGYYTTASGEGVKIVNADGSLVASTTYTTADSKWNSELSSLTLYARYTATPDYTYVAPTSGSTISAGDTVLTSTGGIMVFDPGTYATTLSYTTYGLLFGNTGSGGVVVQLNKLMQVGTRIITSYYIGAASIRGFKLATADGIVKATYEQNAIGTYTDTYTVTADDGLDGTNLFRILRYNNAYLKSITIYNCGETARTIVYRTNGSSSGSLFKEGHADGSDAVVADNRGLLQHSGDSVFAGWATTANATTVEYAPGETIDDISADVYLYPVWERGYYLLPLNGANSSGKRDSINFYVPNKTSNTAYTVNGVTFCKTYYYFNEVPNGTGSPFYIKAGARMAFYDTKTNNTTISVYLYNKGASAANFYYQVGKEGDVQSPDTVSVSATSGRMVSIPVSHNKGSRVLFGVSNKSNLFITQIKVIETGDAILTAGQAGYELAMPGRPLSNVQNTSGNYTGSVDGLIFHSATSNFAFNTSSGAAGYLEITGTSEVAASDSVFFSISEPVQLQVTNYNDNYYTYYAKQTNTFNSSTDTPHGVRNGVSKVNLTSIGNWYILSTRTHISKIAFAAAPVITYDANGGDGSMDNTIATIATNTFTREGYTFIGWNTANDGTGDPYTAGTEVYESLDLYAQWAHTITYHSATEDDYVVDSIEDGAKLTAKYVPAYCAPDRVFVGWARSEVSTQQSEPTIVSEDGTFAEVTADMDLYAVFANRSGGKVTDSVTVSEGFETYSTSITYTSPNRKFSNSTTGLSWIIDYGNVTNTGAGIFSSVKDVILNAKQKTSNLRSSSPVDDVISVSLRSARNNGSIYGTLKWTTDTASWPDSNIKSLSLSSVSISNAVKDSVSFAHPQRTFIKVANYAAVSGDGTRYLYIDSIVFTKAVANYYYTDYSTTCTSGSAAITWENNGGTLSAGTQPADTTIRSWKKLPTVTRANYRFDGWKATINGSLKSDVYDAGEWFLIGHDVTLTAQWTRYIEDIDGVSPITTGNGIAVRSYEVDSIVVNSATATTPTVNKTGTDASLFAVTIDAANKRVADGKTHFPYYVTYTPTEHEVTNSVDISFTCDGIESSAITVRGRSLPEEFVIAVKKGNGTWVALPNTILDNKSAITPIEIVVDNTTTPTKAVFAPSSTAYKTDGRYASGANVYGLRFTDGVLKDTKYNHLQVSSSSGTNYVWLSYTGSSTCQDWYLQSEDLSVYKLKVPTSGAGDKKLGLYSSYIGYYASPSYSDIYFLPIENKATQYEATVTTWSQHHLEVTLAEALESDADGATATLGATNDDATEITGSGTQYSLTFDDLDLAGQSGEKLLIVWKNGGSTIGGSVVTIPSIIAPSADQDTWSEITATASDIVVLNQSITIDVTDAVAKEIVLTNDAQLSIGANKALVVTDKIKREDGSSTKPADIIIQSSATGNGTLIFTNDGDSATIQMYSKATTEGTNWTWQYIGIPFVSTNPVNSFYGGYLYEWPSDCSGWEVVTRNTTLSAFTGYCVSYPSAGNTFSMEGELASTEDDVEITVPAGKEMVIGNSWTAPIQITQMTTGDFVKVNATIYLFNTGSQYDEVDEEAEFAPGTYITIPINEAEDVGVTKISSLQGFYVEQDKTNYEGQDGTLTLSYEKHVRLSGTNTPDNGPMYAPKRTKTDERPTMLKMTVSGSRYKDQLIVLERGDFSTGFDNGWDGKKLDEPGAQPMLYTTREDGTADAVSALPELDGTIIGFRAGEDTTYTLRFEYNDANDANDELYLLDTETHQYTQIVSGATYPFTDINTEPHQRFILTRNKAPQITTGEKPTSDSSLKGRATKLILDQKLYIYRNGVLYDAMGKRVSELGSERMSEFESGELRVERGEKGGAE